MDLQDPPTDGVHTVTITPDLARHWLSFNTHNRRTRERVVRSYAADMQNDDWMWNGETLKFAANPTVLLDGQHRLQAIVEADATLDMLVIGGVKDQAQDTVDGGIKRKFADVLTLRGEHNATVLAAIIRRVYFWESGARTTKGGTTTPSNAQLLQVLDKYPGLREVASSAGNIASKCPLPASIVGLGWWLFEQLDADDCDFFFGRLADWQGLVKGDPIYELRKVAENSVTVRGSRNEAYLTAVMIKAWNAYRAGDQVGQLKFRPGGSRPERFPEPA